jgi:hypothetical protein
VQCTNNLHTIAIAALDYKDTAGCFPRATHANDALPPEERLGWQFELLPYLEQDRLYCEFDPGQGWDAPYNQAPASFPLKCFRCPKGDDAAPNLTYYVGLAGLGPHAADLPKDSPKAGLFGWERTVTIKDIGDGTSNTILAIESFVNNGPWAAGGPATVRCVDVDDQPYIGTDRPFGRVHADRTWFGTMPMPANAALADGSVRQLQHTINPRTFEALVTINGGEERRDDF